MKPKNSTKSKGGSIWTIFQGGTAVGTTRRGAGGSSATDTVHGATQARGRVRRVPPTGRSLDLQRRRTRSNLLSEVAPAPSVSA